MGKIKRLTAQEVEKILTRFGFAQVSQRGSHRKWHNSDSRLTVIVPLHGSKELPIGTLRQIMLAAHIPETEWQIP